MAGPAAGHAGHAGHKAILLDATGLKARRRAQGPRIEKGGAGAGPGAAKVA